MMVGTTAPPPPPQTAIASRRITRDQSTKNKHVGLFLKKLSEPGRNFQTIKTAASSINSVPPINSTNPISLALFFSPSSLFSFLVVIFFFSSSSTRRSFFHTQQPPGQQAVVKLQVSPLPPGTFIAHTIGFSIPTARRFSSNFAYSRSHALSDCNTIMN